LDSFKDRIVILEQELKGYSGTFIAVNLFTPEKLRAFSIDLGVELMLKGLSYEE